MVLITGIMTGMVVFSLGRNELENPDKQLQRLAGLTEHWCQRSILEGRSLGIRITETGYDFWVPDSLGEGDNDSDQSFWQSVADEPAFAPHQWADSLRVSLLLQGQQSPLDTDQPQVICFASSELTPFALNLRLPGESPANLQGELNGRLQITARDN